MLDILHMHIHVYVHVFDCVTFAFYRLQLFQRFEKFRIIVFGGDGSIGWVLSAVDKFNLHSKVKSPI